MTDSEFAKTHLREHLGSLLVSPISEGFWSIYNSSKDLCARNGQMPEVLRTFQNMLTRIPEWSDATLTTEVERIQKTTKCNYLDDLIMGVFIAYMKSFASLHYHGSSTEIKVDFDRPSLTKFIHELYKNCARKVWQVAYLFKTVGTTSEQQARNRQDIEKLVADCMEHVIRGFLPWEAIAKKYFAEESVEDIIRPVEESKAVSFGHDSESEEEEEKPTLTLSDETTTIQFEDLDKPVEVEVEVNPLDEITSKMGDTLVLNL